MSHNIGRMIVEGFLESSLSCVKRLVKELHTFEGDDKKKVSLYYIQNNRIKEIILDGEHFFFRSSVEYTNPQLTVESVQGIIAARLLEACGNYFEHYGFHDIENFMVDEICETLSKPSFGKIVPFLLNTDDVEPDRYSINPLKGSIVLSGQSAFPSAFVKVEELEIDQNFWSKYKDSLISDDEIELIDRHLNNSNNNYLDFVDSVKYEQLENLSETFGINLCIPSMRMPLTVLEKETTDDLLHYIIKESHRSYESIERVYNCMGRSLKKRTTLLTVPHSEKGYGSKRAARGKIYFEGTKLERVRVTYRTSPLYPNAIDSDDVSIAHADERFIIEGQNFMSYDFDQLPSSPQFVLYSLGSPEDASLWHGVGAFGASQLVKSYTTTRMKCVNDSLFTGLIEKYGVRVRPPLQFNIVPEKMWVHPEHRNIDSSIGCVKNIKDLAEFGMSVEHLPNAEYIRK